MSTSESIPPEWRDELKAYARMVVGAESDAEQCVQALEQEQREDGPGQDTSRWKFALFQRLHALCADRKVQSDPRSSVPDSHSVHLARLLMENGFSAEDAGAICRLSPVAAQRIRREADASLSKRVFVIEDEPYIAQQLCHLMEDMGLTVVGSAATESAAVATTQGRKLDLIVADVSLTGSASGIVTANRIRGQRDIPILYVTAHPARLQPDNMRANDMVLEKPCTVDEITSSIARTLDGSQTEGD